MFNEKKWNAVLSGEQTIHEIRKNKFEIWKKNFIRINNSYRIQFRSEGIIIVQTKILLSVLQDSIF